MTMLDTMRRHQSWLKWTLALVVVAFIAFYAADFSRPASGASNEDLARVGGETIDAGSFRRQYQQMMRQYRQAYGGNVNEQMLKQLGLEQQIIRQMVDERAAVAEARRLGLSVSDAEVAARIFAIPAFQQNGAFAGEEVYSRVLASQSPPLTKAEFEEGLRRSLLVDKLRSALTEWVTVPEADLTAEYNRRNQKVKAELVVFSADRMRDQVSVTDQDVAAYFEAHKENYRIGERRRIKYLLIDVEGLRAKVIVPPGDVEKSYRDNEPTYTTPAQVRASHILLKTEGKDDAAVKARAEALLKQARSGADFAELARKNSEDEVSAKQGGDLDYFGRGRMTKEFEDVAFSLEPGQLSDVIKTPFGYHIIKVTDKKPESKRPLEEVRQQIADQLAYERAQSQAQTLAEQIAGELKTPADLDRVGKARGLTVTESGLFTRDEPIAGLGPAPEVTGPAFDQKQGVVAGPVRVARGLVFFATTGQEAARLPALSEVKDKAREDAIRATARELSTTRAQALAAQFKADFAGAARTAGLTPKTSELVARGTAWPDAGISTAVDEAVFSLPPGGVTGPIATDAGTVIARVVERQDPKPEELAAAKSALKEELLADRKSKFFSAYMVKARDRMKIEINQEAVRQIVG